MTLHSAGLLHGFSACPCTPSLGYKRASGSMKARCSFSCRSSTAVQQGHCVMLCCDSHACLPCTPHCFVLSAASCLLNACSSQPRQHAVLPVFSQASHACMGSAPGQHTALHTLVTACSAKCTVGPSNSCISRFGTAWGCLVHLLMGGELLWLLYVQCRTAPSAPTQLH